MGSDNQAERVVARLEYREKLAKEFHKAFRRRFPSPAPPWTQTTKHWQAAVKEGINAVINTIEEDSVQHLTIASWKELKEASR